MGINGIEKLHDGPKPSEAQLRRQVNEEIPWVVGQGSFIINKRRFRLRELMREHGYDDVVPPMWNGPRS